MTGCSAGPPRKPESPVTQREMDLAASIQKVTEEVMLRLARTVHRDLGAEYLCLAGGVALNCVANGRILREGPYRDIWIQPAAGDAGGALGAALAVWHQYHDSPRGPREGDSMHGSYLGPAFSDSEIETSLNALGARYQRLADDELMRQVAGIIAAENVVGWFQGRMEFGPRALGARSIIGDARSPKMQSVMNLKIKYRESFRPFAPAVLARAGCGLLRARSTQSVHAAGGARARGTAHSDERRAGTTVRDRQAQHRRARLFRP